MDISFQKSPLRARHTSHSLEDIFILFSLLVSWRSLQGGKELTFFLISYDRTAWRSKGHPHFEVPSWPLFLSRLQIRSDVNMPPLLHSRKHNSLLLYVCRNGYKRIETPFSVCFPKSTVNLD